RPVPAVAPPRPEGGSEHEREGRLALLHRVWKARERVVPRAAELEGELGPTLLSVRAEELGGRRVAEGAGLLLREHPVGCERPQYAMEDVDVVSGGQLIHRTRALRELVRDAQFRD